MKHLYLTLLLLFGVSLSSRAAIAPITGDSIICMGTYAHFSDSTAGGSWTCDDTSIIKINSAGTVTPKKPGTVTIYYFVGLVSVTKTITVWSSIPVITGLTHLCVGDTMTISDTLIGGQWSSNDTFTATIDSVGIVSGKRKDSTVITYSYSGCSTTIVIHVDSIMIPAPVITGPTHLCIGGTITLSDTLTHGRWSSNDTVIATIDSFGFVHGKRRDSVLLTYSYYSGCTTGKVIYVDSIPSAGTIISDWWDRLCYGGVQYTGSVKGGVWSISDTTLAKIDTNGFAVPFFIAPYYHADTIIYTVTSSCGSNSTILPVIIVQCEGVKIIANPVENMIVLPNPNSGTFTIKISSDKNEPAHILITDLLGRQVKKFAAITNSSIEMKTDLRPGIYCVSAITSGGSFVMKLVVE